MFGKKNIRVLIADDHDLIRDCLSPFVCMISKEHTEIDEASDFFQLMTFDNKEYDIILVDLHMPGMNGLTSIKQIIDKFINIPVVIISGFIQDININEAINLGVKGFIPKNMRGETMVYALQLVMSGEVYIPSKMFLKNTNNKISERENDVVSFLAKGLSNKEIARSLEIREVTVKVHLRNIYRKLGVSNRVQAIRKLSDDFTTKV